MSLLETIGGAIVLGLAIAIILYFIGNYVNVTLYKNSYISHGKRIALLNAIGGSADFVLKDSLDQPKKNVLDKRKLDNFKGNPEIELENLYYYNFDYKLEIKEFDGIEPKSNWEFGFDDLEDFSNFEEKCETIRKGIPTDSSSIPVIIFDGERYNHGLMTLTLTKTPLSNVAFALSIVCSDLVDLDTSKSGYIYSINGIEIENLNNGLKNVCIVYDKNNKEKKMCKKIICDSKIARVKICEFPSSDCSKIKDTLCEKVYEDLCRCFKHRPATQIMSESCQNTKFCQKIIFQKINDNEVRVFLPQEVSLDVR